ncbi:TonB-dependent receptor [Aliarcobacter butzleri]|uniref:TonB-dependent siderophore receptor n=1 Tax=Aliarcobacter butzleri TaxID=28197 RepID=UPI00263D115B|nr:TonB-dependent receptor [Aliarcobacter butzleri]MDN5077435.1 TonB-dependent receptor [Aliarcobacter butzleri]MDN5118551.1 TonB-dependent receptor [Aliarcobacter butzleri]
MKNDFTKKNLSIKLCAILLSSSAVFAQEATTQLDTITVSGTSNSNYQSDEKANINRTKVSKEDMAKSVQTFNQNFIEDAQLQNIDNVITMASNTVYTGDTDGKSTNITIRGFSGTPILFDGIKYTNSIAHPEIYNLESVEVLKGPDSLQYGQSSPGGLVNLVTKKPTKNSLASIEFEASDNPSYSPKLDLGGALNENKSLYFRVASVLKYDEGWTNSNTDTNKIFIAPSLAYDINDNNTLTFVTEYTDEKTPTNFGSNVNSKGKLVAPIKNVTGHPDEEFEKTQKVAGFDLDSVFDTWTSNLRYRYFDNVRDYGNVYLPLMYLESTNTVRRFAAEQKTESSEHALQYTLNKEFDLFGKENNLSVGADYNKAYSETFSRVVQGKPFDINLENPIYEPYIISVNDLGLPIRNMSSPKTWVESYGIFLQDSINLTDDLIFNAGVRYSESKPQTGQKTDATTPSFGLVYHISPQTSVYANYSESFSPNSRLDINGKILNPEEGKGYEFGVKQKLFDDRFDLTTAFFKIEKENVAELDENDPTKTRYKASGEQESNGFEIDLSGDITSDWSVITSYGYTDTKNKLIDNNELRNAPNHTVNLFTTYKLSALNLPNYYIGGGAKYIGSKYADDANSIKLDSALIYNATIGYKKGNWKANLSVQNLTDEEYVDGSASGTTSDTRVYVGTPRTVLATVGYTF